MGIQLQSFDIGKWQGKLLWTPAAFETLANLAEHPAAAEEFKQSISVSSYGSASGLQGAATQDQDVMERIRDHIYRDALFAVEHYAALMVVTAATYVENMFFEFLSALFIAKPAAIHRHLMGDDSKRDVAVVPLKEILDAKDLSELRVTLAFRAAKNANNGPIAKVISRIEAITERTFPKLVCDSIVDIVRLRNQIVHDGLQPTREAADVKARYRSLESLLAELGRQCQSCEIPYFDPGLLIDEIPPPGEPPDGYPLF